MVGSLSLLSFTLGSSRYGELPLTSGIPNPLQSIMEYLGAWRESRRYKEGVAKSFSGKIKFPCIEEEGCTYIAASFQEYFIKGAKVIMFLVEAIDIYLLGTVMLVFGMGLYELFISNLDKSKLASDGTALCRSNLFGLFTLKERPRWLEIKTVNELKTKLGHVIVMLLLIGLFEKSKKAIIQTPVDLLCFSASILLSSGCLYLLSKLND